MAAAPSVRLISVSLAAADDGTGGELSCNVRVSGSSTSLALSYLTAQLGLAPAPLYTARVYPNAYMYALHRPARQFRLDDDSGCIRLSGLDTSTEYVLALGVRDQDEYVAAQSALLGPATPGAADGFDVGAGKPFQLNLSDIHIASILSEAVNTADYQSRLTEPILSSFRGSPAVWSLGHHLSPSPHHRIIASAGSVIHVRLAKEEIDGVNMPLAPLLDGCPLVSNGQLTYEISAAAAWDVRFLGDPLSLPLYSQQLATQIIAARATTACLLLVELSLERLTRATAELHRCFFVNSGAEQRCDQLLLLFHERRKHLLEHIAKQGVA